MKSRSSKRNRTGDFRFSLRARGLEKRGRARRLRGEFRASRLIRETSEDEVDRIARCYAVIATAEFIEPTTWERGGGAGHGQVLRQVEKGGKRPVRGFWNVPRTHGADERVGRLRGLRGDSGARPTTGHGETARRTPTGSRPGRPRTPRCPSPRSWARGATACCAPSVSRRARPCRAR